LANDFRQPTLRLPLSGAPGEKRALESFLKPKEL